MIFVSRKKKIKIGKLIGATKHIAVYSIGEMDKKTQIENMTKIVENLADLAFEIGGEIFAMIDVVAEEYALQEALKKRKRLTMDKRKYTIYAVDFDGTLCESIFPGIGSPNMALINHLIKRKKQGNKIILWTCRVNERLQEAVEWCKGYGLEFDAINENLPEMIESHGGSDSRKIFADIYIDDKAVNKSKYCVPYKEVDE